MPTIISYLEVNTKINKYINYKKLVVFSDMQSIENLLVQYAKLNELLTITMQHGLYIDYTEYENINSINYRNQVSDYFLSWGDDTSELISKWNPETKFFLCGKPIKKEKMRNEESDYFTLLFDQNLLISYNREMLQIAYKIAEKLKLRVNIRFHPRNNPLSYRIRKSQVYINKDIYESKFIIAHTTSLIHELLRQDVLVFKYDSKIPAITIPESLKFKDDKELLKKMDSLKDDKIPVEKYIKYIDKESLDKYNEFFTWLENKK